MTVFLALGEVRRLCLTILALAATVGCATAPRPGQQATSTPITRGIATADSLVAASIGTITPGAVLLVAQNGKVIHERAFGYAEQFGSDGKPLASPRMMRMSTYFDLASVTKVMATTFAVMLLVDRGQVDLDAPVYRYLPDFRGPHHDSITVRHLLNHSSGLVQWQPLYYWGTNKSAAYKAIREMPLQWGVGQARHYSDLGFMLLGYIVERVSGKSLNEFLEQTLYAPLAVKATFLPRARGITDFAATETGNAYEKHMVYDPNFGYDYAGDPKSWDGWRSSVTVGDVNDGNAFYGHGGVAGHAGLFARAADLEPLMELVLNGGALNNRRYVRKNVIDGFLTLDSYGHYLGWQKPDTAPPGSFMHTGFTGTYVAGVPKYGLAIILLTNRQHMGTNERGFFPDPAPLRNGVMRAIIAGAAGNE
jgi:CubicO group peptidase (beta-lactamase class C family)